MALIGKTVGKKRKFIMKVRTTRHKYKIPTMDMFEKNKSIDNEYLTSQINNFDAILNSLRNERY